MGRGLLHRRRGLLARDRAARVRGRVVGSHPIQIFGSDVSEAAIEKARAGVYPDSAMRDVSEERRRRYFSQGRRAAIASTRRVRDLCVFVRHDLARDPPFSKLDLVSCRNVLIYFDQALQKRVVANFHYALNQPGFLLLGRSESISGFGQLFSVVDKANKIFARTARREHARASRPAPTRGAVARRRRGARHERAGQPARSTSRSTSTACCWPATPRRACSINDKLEILLFRGRDRRVSAAGARASRRTT